MMTALPLLMEVFWKSGVVLGVALCVAALLRKKSADVRRVVLATAIVALFVAAVASSALPRWTAVVPAWVPRSQATPVTSVWPITRAAAAQNQTLTAEASDTVRRPSPRTPDVIVRVWFTGTALFLLRLIIGLFGLRRLRDASIPLSKDGLPDAVTLLENEALAAPVTWGMFRPVILVPSRFRQLPAESRDAILCHELGHIDGHDFLIRVLADVGRALIWFQPLVWIVRRQLRREQELACDDRVVAAGGKPSVYAKLLMNWDLGKPRGNAQLAVGMAQESCLKRRLYALLDHDLERGAVSRAGAITTWCLGLAMTLLLATMGVAQQKSDSVAATAQFEVASIRPTEARGQHGITAHGGPGTSDPTRIEWTNTSVTLILQRALHAYLYQIVRPAWVDTQSYDITATLPPGTTKEQFGQMLINLLEDRFHLALHRETRELPGFELVLGKNGAKLREAAPADSDNAEPVAPDASVPPKTDPNGFPVVDRPGVAIAMKMKPGASVPLVYLTARAQALGELVHMLGDQLGRPVVDKTGLTGKYDYTLEFPAMESPDAQDEAGPSILTAVQKQLGLKLESKRVPLEMVIVDHSDKTPSGN
jgi:uncharacterized protein (TIGR03435 family)